MFHKKIIREQVYFMRLPISDTSEKSLFRVIIEIRFDDKQLTLSINSTIIDTAHH